MCVCVCVYVSRHEARCACSHSCLWFRAIRCMYGRLELVNGIDLERLEEIREAFGLFDADDSGRLWLCCLQQSLSDSGLWSPFLSSSFVRVSLSVCECMYM
jgi:hypothetical protein